MESAGRRMAAEKCRIGEARFHRFVGVTISLGASHLLFVLLLSEPVLSREFISSSNRAPPPPRPASLAAKSFGNNIFCVQTTLVYVHRRYNARCTAKRKELEIRASLDCENLYIRIHTCRINRGGQDGKGS